MKLTELYIGRPVYSGIPGRDEEKESRRKDADPAGSRAQRRAWARKHGKPMPRKGDGADGQQEA